MTVISLTVLMGLMKKAVKQSEEKGRRAGGDGHDCNDSGHLGKAANDAPERGRWLLKSTLWDFKSSETSDVPLMFICEGDQLWPLIH